MFFFTALSLTGRCGDPELVRPVLEHFDFIELSYELRDNEPLAKWLGLPPTKIQELSRLQMTDDFVSLDTQSFRALEFPTEFLVEQTGESHAQVDAKVRKKLVEVLSEEAVTKLREWGLRKRFPRATQCLERETFDYCGFDAEDRRLLVSVAPKIQERYAIEENRIRSARGHMVFDRFSDRVKVKFSKYAGPKYSAISVAEPVLEGVPPVCWAFRSPYVLSLICGDTDLAKELSFSKKRQNDLAAAYHRLLAGLPSPIENKNMTFEEVQELSNAMEDAFHDEVLRSLDANQTTRLKHWVACKYFEGDPLRELTNPPLAKYLSIEPQEWISIQEMINESKKISDLQRGLLNRETIERIAGVVQSKSRVRFLELFKGVW